MPESPGFAMEDFQETCQKENRSKTAENCSFEDADIIIVIIPSNNGSFSPTHINPPPLKDEPPLVSKTVSSVKAFLVGFQEIIGYLILTFLGIGSLVGIGIFTTWGIINLTEFFFGG